MTPTPHTLEILLLQHQDNALGQQAGALTSALYEGIGDYLQASQHGSGVLFEDRLQTLSSDDPPSYVALAYEIMRWEHVCEVQKQAQAICDTLASRQSEIPAATQALDTLGKQVAKMKAELGAHPSGCASEATVHKTERAMVKVCESILYRSDVMERHGRYMIHEVRSLVDAVKQLVLIKQHTSDPHEVSQAHAAPEAVIPQSAPKL